MKRLFYIIPFTALGFICHLNISCSDFSSEMVTVEGGILRIGSNSELINAQPAHSVALSSFKISKYEVTVARYREFCLATGHEMGDAPPWGWDDTFPMVYVSYDDAKGTLNRSNLCHARGLFWLSSI